jgi:eukaryotic-like serine/threonine-protein kinase
VVADGGRLRENRERMSRRDVFRTEVSPTVEAGETVESRDPWASIASASFEQVVVPSLVGRFEVRECLARGAMGIVFRAHDPKLDRDVAIKVLASSRTASSGRRGRMLREAQGMAKLSHPNVVTVHEVGEVDEGVFIAMELVDGTTVTDWLAAARRSWREVRDVFLSAGRGLAAAHDAGVYHRDFKPDNVMIGRDGRVRVMDFGLARLELDPSEPASDSDVDYAEGSDLLSLSGEFAGTPAYMAPEQFDGIADARCDQFSFCVALFEALFGRRPFEGKTIAALRLATTTGEIRLPSRRANVPAWLRRTVVRGLAANPEDRHESMATLLEALTHDRVLGRRRTGVAIAGLGVAIVLTGLVWRSDPPVCSGATQTMEETWSKTRADDLLDAFVASKLPYAAQSAELAIRHVDELASRWIEVHIEVCERGLRHELSSELLDRRMSCLDQHRRTLDATIDVVAEADHEVVKRAIEVIAGVPVADECLREADVMPLMPPADVAADVQAIRTLMAEAEALARAGKWPRAEALAEAALQQAQTVGWDPVVAEALRTFGLELIRREEYPRAAEPLVEGFFLASEVGRYELAAETAEKLVRVSSNLGRTEEAMTWSRHAELALERSAAGPIQRARLEDAIANALTHVGRFDEAAARQTEAIALAERSLPQSELLLADILTNSAQTLTRSGRGDEAVLRIERAVAISEAALGPDHPKTLVSLNNLGIVLRRLGRLDEALEVHHRALEIWEREWGPDDVETLTCRESLGQTLAALGRLEEALEILRDVLARTRARGDDPSLSLRANNVGHVLSLLGRNEEALAVFENALTRSVAALGSDHINNAVFLANIGSVLSDLGRHEEAIEHLERSLALRREHLGPAHGSVGHSMQLLGIARSATGRHPQALEILHDLLVMRERDAGTSTKALAHTLAMVGEAERASGDLGAARKSFERAVALVDADDLQDATAGRVRLGLAVALEQDATARTRAVEQARLAERLLRSADDPRAADARAWLARHER